MPRGWEGRQGVALHTEYQTAGRGHPWVLGPVLSNEYENLDGPGEGSLPALCSFSLWSPWYHLYRNGSVAEASSVCVCRLLQPFCRDRASDHLHCTDGGHSLLVVKSQGQKVESASGDPAMLSGLRTAEMQRWKSPQRPWAHTEHGGILGVHMGMGGRWQVSGS